MRLDRLSEAAKVNTDAMRSAQEEITEYRRQLQARTTELEALKGTKDSLERQRSDLEDRHQADIASYQVGWSAPAGCPASLVALDCLCPCLCILAVVVTMGLGVLQPGLAS